MNLKYLGDAFDYWKGSLIEALQDKGLVSNLAVDRMRTDAKEWPEDDRALYARLLHVNCRMVDTRERPVGDIFLDPDVGVWTGSRSPSSKKEKKYIKPACIRELLDVKPDSERLLIVYQHVRGQKTRNRVCSVIGELKESKHEIGDFYWSSYESNTSAMLFISRSHGRTHGIAQHFSKILGHRVARCRIHEERVPK
jgi:hypothetical protein